MFAGTMPLKRKQVFIDADTAFKQIEKSAQKNIRKN
jgi:hypothetical protein